MKKSMKTLLLAGIILVLCGGSFVLGRYCLPSSPARTDVMPSDNGQALASPGPTEAQLAKAVDDAIANFNKASKESKQEACWKIASATSELAQYYANSKQFDRAYLAWIRAGQYEKAIGVYGNEDSDVQYAKYDFIEASVKTNGEAVMQILRNPQVPADEKTFVIDIIEDTIHYSFESAPSAAPATATRPVAP